MDCLYLRFGSGVEVFQMLLAGSDLVFFVVAVGVVL